MEPLQAIDIETTDKSSFSGEEGVVYTTEGMREVEEFVRYIEESDPEMDALPDDELKFDDPRPPEQIIAELYNYLYGEPIPDARSSS